MSGDARSPTVRLAPKAEFTCEAHLRNLRETHAATAAVEVGGENTSEPVSWLASLINIIDTDTM
jgi:hypothetical protein